MSKEKVNINMVEYESLNALVADIETLKMISVKNTKQYEKKRKIFSVIFYFFLVLVPLGLYLPIQGSMLVAALGILGSIFCLYLNQLQYLRHLQQMRSEYPFARLEDWMQQLRISKEMLEGMSDLTPEVVIDERILQFLEHFAQQLYPNEYANSALSFYEKELIKLRQFLRPVVYQKMEHILENIKYDYKMFLYANKRLLKSIVVFLIFVLSVEHSFVLIDGEFFNQMRPVLGYLLIGLWGLYVFLCFVSEEQANRLLRARFLKHKRRFYQKHHKNIETLKDRIEKVITDIDENYAKFKASLSLGMDVITPEYKRQMNSYQSELEKLKVLQKEFDNNFWEWLEVT